MHRDKSKMLSMADSSDLEHASEARTQRNEANIQIFS